MITAPTIDRVQLINPAITITERPKRLAVHVERGMDGKHEVLVPLHDSVEVMPDGPSAYEG